VHKYNSNLQFQLRFGSGGTANGQFDSPRGIAVDRKGGVYVVDTFNDRVQKFIPVPVMALRAGTTEVADETGTYSFGSTLGGSPVAATFTIDNTAGQDTLQLGSLALPAGFSRSGVFPAYVPAGATAEFTVQLDASQPGRFGGTLSFATNVAGLNPYNFTLSGTVKADQTLSFPAIADKLSTDAPFTLAATASSTLPVTFSVTAGPATVSGNVLTLTGPGRVTVRAFQAGDDLYNAVSAEQSFAVAAVLALDTPPAGEVSVYPNPVADLLRVELPPAFAGATLLLTDAGGRVVHSRLVQHPQEALPVAHLPKGLYLLHVRNEKHCVTRKVVIK
jgi:hypothetical protein